MLNFAELDAFGKLYGRLNFLSVLALVRHTGSVALWKQRYVSNKLAVPFCSSNRAEISV